MEKSVGKQNFMVQFSSLAYLSCPKKWSYEPMNWCAVWEIISVNESERGGCTCSRSLVIVPKMGTCMTLEHHMPFLFSFCAQNNRVRKL